MSSSAALETSLLRALRAAFNLMLDDVTIAKLGQRAENDLVGAPVGIMDQMASSVGTHGSALFIDTRTLAHERVKIPSGVDLIVIDSGVKHDHGAGDYRVRRRECEEAAAQLGVKKLRDVSIQDLERINRLPEPIGRRARHVVTENERVLRALDAMRMNDLFWLGDLFYASHESMRSDFEVSVPEIDLLVSLARKESDILGARLTGGGFGGSTVMLAKQGTGLRVARRIADKYASETGRTPAVLLPDASSNANARASNH